MPVTVERVESHWLIRVEGEFPLTSAAEMKQLLLEWLASGKDLQLDLTSAGEIDIALLQLLWAAGRQATLAGAQIVSRISEHAAATARDLGFDPFPGGAAQG